MKRSDFTRKQTGFVLLECILALALFATVATAMAVALNQLASSSIAIRQETILLRRLESELAEISHLPRLPLGRFETPRDESGVSVSIEVERFVARNQSGQSLQGLYRIKASGSMSSRPGAHGSLTREMETLVFQPVEKAAQNNFPRSTGPAEPSSGTTR